MRNVNLTFSSKLLNEFDRFLKVVSANPEPPNTPTPQSTSTSVVLSAHDKKNIQGLMRINHTGEVCAQALYYRQALFAKEQKTHQNLINAAN